MVKRNEQAEEARKQELIDREKRFLKSRERRAAGLSSEGAEDVAGISALLSFPDIGRGTKTNN